MTVALILDLIPEPLASETEALDEDEQRRALNPIESRILALGLRTDGETSIMLGEERLILEGFWTRWRATRSRGGQLAGFNIAQFHLPFLVTRSLILDVPIEPFTRKEIIDLRERLSAYRTGKVRGTLRELAQLIGAPEMLSDASDAQSSRERLVGNLDALEAIYERARRLRILDIQRW